LGGNFIPRGITSPLGAIFTPRGLLKNWPLPTFEEASQVDGGSDGDAVVREVAAGFHVRLKLGANVMIKFGKNF
jgi:hypothetical protein